MLRRLCTARETKLQLAGEPSTREAERKRGKDHVTRTLEGSGERLTQREWFGRTEGEKKREKGRRGIGRSGQWAGAGTEKGAAAGPRGRGSSLAMWTTLAAGHA
ncbi:hypothetical protein GCM10009549_10050 [Streptomyces thermoalcalitolerans]|uniref:Uncharacterized protein n=1 Tax=Streptomyces thermoalcalitolerans TaxID=65605 RepID=A0ABN1NFL3_9ACTN